MSRVKLQTKKGKPVKEWVISPAELRKLNRDFKDVSSKQRIKPVQLQIPVEELQILPDKFTYKHLLEPHWFWPIYFCKPKYRVRRNQKNLTEIQWQRFIHTIEALAETSMPSPNMVNLLRYIARQWKHLLAICGVHMEELVFFHGIGSISQSSKQGCWP